MIYKRQVPPSATERKAQLAAEGKQARAEYLAKADAIDRNTIRLRALRLAKENEDALAAPNKKPLGKKW
jgi:hypothetical protein